MQIWMIDMEMRQITLKDDYKSDMSVIDHRSSHDFKEER